MGDWAGLIQQSTSSTSIRLVTKTMGGGEGGNVTINRVEGGVEGGHGREEGGEE
jgi:hypothetical protein